MSNDDEFIGVGTGRYRLYVVYRDGVPQETDSSDDLAVMLRRRDEECKRPAAQLPSPYELWGVFDNEDPERGDLDWDAHEFDEEEEQAHA